MARAYLLCTSTSEAFIFFLCFPSLWSLTSFEGTKAGLAEGKSLSLLDWPSVSGSRPCLDTWKHHLGPRLHFLRLGLFLPDECGSQPQKLFLFLSVQPLRSEKLCKCIVFWAIAMRCGSSLLLSCWVEAL